MISVTQLESVSQQENLYMKSWNNHSKAVKHELNNEDHEYYKIELLLNHHLYWYDYEEFWLKYKIKWKDYKSEFSSWKAEHELNCKDLILIFDIQNSQILWVIFNKMMIKWSRN